MPWSNLLSFRRRCGRLLVACCLAVTLAQSAWAHPGHDGAAVSEMAHWLTPVHLCEFAALAVAVMAIAGWLIVGRRAVRAGRIAT